jgi:hypothetical protein
MLGSFRNANSIPEPRLGAFCRVRDYRGGPGHDFRNEISATANENAGNSAGRNCGIAGMD